jgi:hypothetical protein
MKEEDVMKTRALVFLAVAAILLIGTGLVWGYTESGSNNFFGNGAGANTSGGGDGTEDDTFIGAYAGNQNTTGANNTFIGVGAGYWNTGSGNTFIGWSAGNINTTGDHNTFIGYYAGNNNGAASFNTFLGYKAGYSNTGTSNTFLGHYAGVNNTSGFYNIFIGDNTGGNNTTGSRNTFIGLGAGGNNTTGYGNVFLGYVAGGSEGGSNKLYIDNCYGDGSCTSPFIYGEFDNRILKIDGKLGIKTKPLYQMDISGNGVSKSQMHFSIDGTDTGGWITSYNVNHFWLSSGAVWDYSAGGWIQKSSDGKAVMAGSGGLGYRILFSSGVPVGDVASPTVRFHIDYSGNFGINTSATSGKPINTGTGAYLSSGGAWINASSRQYKENIKVLTTEDADKTLVALNPVTFSYKADPTEQHVGFIAEDVPDLVATKDRKGLSPMDIVAVLTKVVQEQKQTLEEKSKIIEKQQKAFDNLAGTVAQLQAEVNRLKSMSMIVRVIGQE